MQVKAEPIKQEKKPKIEKIPKEAKSAKHYEKKKDKHSNNEKKKLKNPNHQLKVPQAQIKQQISSEREIVDSIALTKDKLEKKDEKHVKSMPRKSKKRKEKKESAHKIPVCQNDSELFVDDYREVEKEFCEKCYQKKRKRKKERAEKKSEEHFANDPDDTFINRHIEDKEVLRRYIDTDKLYETTISNKSSCCVCSIQTDENESPKKLSQVKLEQVRDAVLVVRNWKHTNDEKNSTC